MSIRVILADDHRMFREALQEQLSRETDIEVIAGAGGGEETLATVARLRPDVLVLDIALPDMSGIEVARRLAGTHPGVRIVALSGYVDKAFVEEMLKVGAQGYVVKSSGGGELLAAIRAVAAGQNFLSPEAAKVLLRRFGERGTSGVPPVSVLSPRELDILRLLCDGGSSAGIGAALDISPGTVKVHRRNIKRKLGLKSTAELIRYAIREGVRPT